jgi:hypothetical protein
MAAVRVRVDSGGSSHLVVCSACPAARTVYASRAEALTAADRHRHAFHPKALNTRRARHRRIGA